MQTSGTKLEDMDFKPRLPLLRLAILLIVFCFLTFGFITNTKSRLEFTPITDPGFLSESVFVGLLLLLFLGFMLSYLLLQFRLRFTEEGIRRRTAEADGTAWEKYDPRIHEKYDPRIHTK